MKFLSSVIFYMSGTGNSYRAATWMGETARETGVETQILPVDKGSKVKSNDIGSLALIGIVMPTHGFTAPWHVIRFVFRLPRSNGAHSFVVATRAGTKVGDFPFPGMEGTACYLIALILLMKGYKLLGLMGLDMPSNWMSLHWGLNRTNSDFIIERAKKKITLFMERVLVGRVTLYGIIPLIIGLLLLPISFAYLIIGRFFLAKLFFASYKCNGCAVCAKNCPVGAIKMIGSGNPRPYWRFNCESCMRCMGYCPQKAVEAGHSLGIIFYCIAVLPVSVYLLNLLIAKYPWVGNININNWIKVILDYAYTLLSIYLTYLLFSQLIKIRLINKFFSYTTLTHIYRRYHEPNTTVADMSPRDSTNIQKLSGE